MCMEWMERMDGCQDIWMSGCPEIRTDAHDELTRVIRMARRDVPEGVHDAEKVEYICFAFVADVESTDDRRRDVRMRSFLS